MAFVEVVLCIVILLLLYRHLTSTFDFWNLRGVKGPKPVIGIGNTYRILFGKESTGQYLHNLYKIFREESAVGFFDGREPYLMLKDPELIKDVLIKDFSNFSERDFNVYDKADPFSQHLFRLETARWRPLRTQLSPTFTSGKLKDMFLLLVECSEHFAGYIKELVDKGEPIACREVAARYTTDVIGSCGFGIEMNAMAAEDSEFRRMGRRIFRSDWMTFVRTRLQTCPKVYSVLGYFLSDHDLVDFFTRIVKEAIDFRRKNNVIRHDFVDVLITLKDNPEKLAVKKVTDIYIAAQAFVFFAAGFETSASTISNAMHELALHPEIQTSLREEIDEFLGKNGGAIKYEIIKEMKRLDMFFRETLRKYPVVTFLSRVAAHSYTFRNINVTVPKGQKIVIPVYALHHDPTVFPEPEVFDPERFNTEAVDSRHPMYYLPFGDGPRNCIGARFASFQSKVGLIQILRKYKIDVCEKTQIPINISPDHPFLLQPSHEIYLKITEIAKT